MKSTADYPRAAFGTARVANWYLVRCPTPPLGSSPAAYSTLCLKVLKAQLAKLFLLQGTPHRFVEWLAGDVLFPVDLSSPRRLFALVERVNKIHDKVQCDNGPTFARCLTFGDPDTFYTCPLCGDGLCPDCHDGPFTYCIRCTPQTER